MAYVDRQSGTSRAASIATVGIIHAAIGTVLIYGLAQTIVPRAPPRPFEGTQIPIKPLPTPTPEATETRDPTTSSTVTTAETPFDPVNTADPLPPSPPVENDYVPPTALPTFTPTSTPPPTFAVKRPRPLGDRARWVTNDKYPASEIRRGNQGTVAYRVVVGANGRVTSCEVTRSSGFPKLDEVACAEVKRNGRFEPGTNSSGAKAVDTYSGSVVWRIPED